MSDELSCLVIGAHGFQGAAVARRLHAGGYAVRGFARGTGQAPTNPPEIPMSWGDLGNSDAVQKAFDGITHASVVLPLVYDSELVERFAGNIVEAAEKAGVSRLVYNTNTPVPVEATSYAAYETRRLAERIFADSDVPTVTLRPPVYLDNLFSPWNGPALVNDGVLTYPLAENRKVSWISHADLAEATAAALHRPGIEGTVMDIGGPTPVDGHQLAAEFAAALERPIVYRELEVEQFEAGLRSVLTEDAAGGVAGIYRGAAESNDPDLFVVDHEEVERVLGVRMPSIREWVAEQPWGIWRSTQN